jgi:Protein of unknown function (DUF2934)
MAEQIEPTHAQIRQRAYELFEARGREHGRDVGDWLEAEQHLRADAFESVLRAVVERPEAARMKTRDSFERAADKAAA